MVIIAQCIASTGYGTCSYDAETGDCDYEKYASVDEVILNDEYWDKYDKIMSHALSDEFDLGFGFDRFELTVFEDGTKEAKKLPWRVRC